ncbi:hypothetical protein HanPI659440_Chr04g0163921 [Helianthus annuus]|nr:hypothetical protein HanPI659440_Chr04g0163921 [Helianthus annuus]
MSSTPHGLGVLGLELVENCSLLNPYLTLHLSYLNLLETASTCVGVFCEPAQKSLFCVIREKSPFGVV